MSFGFALAEVTHTPNGAQMIKNFVIKVAHLHPAATPAKRKFIKKQLILRLAVALPTSTHRGVVGHEAGSLRNGSPTSRGICMCGLTLVAVLCVCSADVLT